MLLALIVLAAAGGIVFAMGGVSEVWAEIQDLLSSAG